MKKIIALILVLIFVFTLSACGNKDTASDTNISTPTSSEAFVKPENYATVLLVSINPQFKLYLDESNKVLAVEPVNDDAKSFYDNIDLENKSVEAVVENIVEKANEKGFLKENAVVNFEITEQKDGIDNSDILTTVISAANQKATELKIEIKTEIKESDNSQTTETNSENKQTGESSKTETSSKDEESTSKPTTTTQPTESKATESTPTHTHSYSDATCTAPQKCSCGATEGSALGHKWQDATCEAPKICSVCKATDGKVTVHQFKNGKCIYCQKPDIAELNIGLLQNETFVAYKLIGNNELQEFTLAFVSCEDNVLILAACSFWYYAEPDFDITDSSSVKYNGKDFYGGDGGFDGYWFIVKENTLEVFDEWNDWLHANSQSVATYVMQHNGQIRLIDNKNTNLPYLYEIKK